ncbi:MAG: hypothetical protein ACRC30_16080 [Clostridium sp.]
MENLWNLKNIKRDIKNSPNMILEQQARFFEKSVDDVLYAKIENTKLVEPKKLLYGLATNFSIISPTLDNYTYILLTVYSNPEKNYPVMVVVNDEENSEYICKNEQEFISSLERILGAEETTETIRVLYAKSKNY